MNSKINSNIDVNMKEDQIKKQITKKLKTEKLKASQKVYNKGYYEKNKHSINNKLCTKVVCSACGRSIIKNNLKKHQLYTICKNTFEFNEEVNKRIAANSNQSQFTDKIDNNIII